MRAAVAGAVTESLGSLRWRFAETDVEPVVLSADRDSSCSRLTLLRSLWNPRLPDIVFFSSA
jgi:hypothetical protein